MEQLLVEHEDTLADFDEENNADDMVALLRNLQDAVRGVHMEKIARAPCMAVCCPAHPSPPIHMASPFVPPTTNSAIASSPNSTISGAPSRPTTHPTSTKPFTPPQTHTHAQPRYRHFDRRAQPRRILVVPTRAGASLTHPNPKPGVCTHLIAHSLTLTHSLTDSLSPTRSLTHSHPLTLSLTLTHSPSRHWSCSSRC